MSPTKKSKLNIKFIIFSIFFLVALFLFIFALYPSFKANQDKENLLDLASTIDLPNQPDRINFQALQADNPETAGWITIPGTPINYPVMQTDNNDFYLNHNFHQEETIAGSIFLDFQCDGIRTRNYILYGHYMRDQSMFGSLWEYQEPSYFQANPIIQYDMPGQPGDWEIFSIYTAEANYDYRQPEFIDDNDFYQYVSRLKSQSIYETGVSPQSNDQILTLSTCIYTFDDARFVVQARKI